MEGESDWEKDADATVTTSEEEPAKPMYKLTPKSQLTKKPWKHLARERVAFLMWSTCIGKQVCIRH